MARARAAAARGARGGDDGGGGEGEMTTEDPRGRGRPEPRPPEGGAGPGGAARALGDALWRRPGAVPRWLPADPPGTGPAVVGGVHAAWAARRGRDARSLRRRSALLVLPVLAYPLPWLARLAGRPGARGREQANGALLLTATALAVSVFSALQLVAFGVPAPVPLLLGAALGLPVLALGRSVLVAWRWLTAALPAAPLLAAVAAGPAPPGPGVPDVPFPVAPALLYLLVCYLLATQYDRAVVAAAGACSSVMAVAATAAASSPPAAVAWSALLVLGALVLGDNVRLRRAHGGRLRRAGGTGGGLGGTLASVPAGADQAPGARKGALPGGAGARRGGVPLLEAVLDALWRWPARRPGGPLRLLGGPRRPARGRVVAGVCGALARGSQPVTLTLRVVFPLVGLPLGLVAYLLLWLVLPAEDDPPAEPEDADSEAPPAAPLPLPRELTAWALLLGVSAGLASLTAVQLAQFHQVPALAAVVLGFALGLPFALLPTAPLLTWRVMAAGLFATLLAVGAVGTVGAPPQNLWPWPVAALLALPVVLYAVAVSYPGWISAGVGILTVAFDVLAAYPLTGTHPAQTGWIAAVAAAVLLLGYNVRGRRTAQRRLAEESRLRRRDRARQAVLEERSRIARELHDVVSHHMSMIAIQADAAPYKFAGLEPGPTETFHAIRDAARDALAEMRRVVGLLREEDEGGPERAPQPGLALVPELVAQARQAGMDIALDAPPPEEAPPGGTGAPGLPDAVDLSAYRIVQESISNAGRHAPGAAVSVALRRTPSQVTVRVVNGPPAPAAAGGGRGAVDSGGHGLVGMRERVAMLGGRLRAGPTAEGGFEVVAELPPAAPPD
ncbi:histidine kinase [Streptomonospora nanhaiensis]|uniref:sensor histidine kinase n=2 Tax=Streptomonospora nanhaiensis TaxID=1323731 RepID=UPI0036211E3B